MTSSDGPFSNELEPSRPDWLKELAPEHRHRVHVCFGKNCTPNGAEAAFAAFQSEIRSRGLTSDVDLIATSCRSRCEVGPSVNVYPGPVMYGYMDAERARRVVAEHLVAGGRPVDAFVVTENDVAEAKRRAGV